MVISDIIAERHSPRLTWTRRSVSLSLAVTRQKKSPLAVILPWTPFVVLAGAAYLPGLWPQTAGSLGALLALLWSAWVLKNRATGTSLNFSIPFIALALWAGAGSLWSQNPGATLHSLLYVGLAVIVYRAAREPGAVEPHRLFFFLTLLGAVRTAELLIYGLFVKEGVAVAFWGSPNPNFAGLTAALGAVASLRGVHGTSRARRAAWVLPIVTGLTLFGHNMMGPLFALLIGALVWSAVDRRKPKILWSAPLFAAFLLTLFAFGPSFLLNNPGDPARLERLTIWKDTLRMIVAHPWGAGLGTFETFVREFQSLPGTRVAPHAHNEFLELLFELGLPGGLTALALFAGAVGGSVRKTFGPIRRPPAEQSNEAARWGLLGALSAAAFVDFPMRAMFPLLLAAFVLAMGQANPPSPKPRASNGAWVVLMILIALGHGAVAGLGFFHRLGKARLHSGDYAGALPWFERAAHLWPWEPHLYFDQADCFVRTNRPDEAAARLTRSLRRSPRDIVNRRALAKLTLARNGPADAARVYAPILQMAPTYAPYWREMGDLLLWSGDTVQAERHRARAQNLLAGE